MKSRLVQGLIQETMLTAPARARTAAANSGGRLFGALRLAFDPMISINAVEWETRFGHELASDTTPEKLFERRWAMVLFDQALTRLHKPRRSSS
jgi:hypothetical protein